MKKIVLLFLAAGMLFGASTSASAIDFKTEGEWLFGFGVGDGAFLSHTRSAAETSKEKRNNADKFSAMQRIRLQLEAVASESLSGTLRLEIGDTTWGKNDEGGALGGDGVIVKVLNAYMDWVVPDTELKVRMGLQPVALPNVAGGSSILDEDSLAAVALNYKFNDNVGLTFFWGRPYNDNYAATGNRNTSNDKNGYLDNEDLFALSLPLTYEGFEMTPWVMYGMIGQNTYQNVHDDQKNTDSNGVLSAKTYNVNQLLAGYQNGDRWASDGTWKRNGDTYANAFWAGLPVKLSLWDPLNIEFDISYGYMASQGSGNITRHDQGEVGISKRFDTRREGWLAKALVEYKMDWGTPGIFGWYASGDDDNPKNGSERLPAISPKENFTSFFGDGNLGWGPNAGFYDRTLNYAGTWGIGLQVSDMSFVEDLKHTIRVAYWGGTNSPSMAKYANHSWDWSTDYDSGNSADQLYLTSNDGMLELNLVNSYKMYENFGINLELGYIVNMVDHDTWKKAGSATYEKQDAWKAQLTFAYTF